MNKLLERGQAAIPAQYLAAVLMALGGCCFTTMDTFAKLLSDVHGVPVAFIDFCRMSVTAGLACLYMHHTGIEHPILGPPDVRAWLLLRGALGAVNVFFFYTSLRVLQLGDAISIWFTCPIIVSVLAAVFIGEPYTPTEGICGGVSIIGVLFVIRPPLLFGSQVETSDTGTLTQALGFFQAGIGTLLGAIVFVVLRHCRGRVNALFFVSYFGIVTTPLMAFVMWYDEEQRPDWSTFDLPVLLYLAGLSFTGFLATFIMNKAVELSKLGRTTLLLYVQLPLTVFLSWLAFGDVMSIWSGVGCIIIVGSAIAITLSKEEQSPGTSVVSSDAERGTTHDGVLYSSVGQEEEEHEMEKSVPREGFKPQESPA